MTQGMEKRKFYRLPYPLDVVVEIVTVAETPRDVPVLHLHSRNISKEGICLETETLEWNGVSLIAGAPCARESRLRMTLLLELAGPSLTVIGEEQLLHFLKSRQPKGIIQRLFR
jgi:hypothetical protein